ncbi:MAG: SOS response-associated peptidase [Candidatus Limnocylindrales bacterium]
MCGRFTQQRPAPELAALFKAEPLVEDTGPRFNVAPSQGVIAVVRPPQDDRLLTTFRWGLIPSWASDTKIGYRLINARAESIFTSPAFRTSIRHKRCLIPVDAFYEWQRREGAPKQPYAVHRRDGEPMALAGIWATWLDPVSEEWLRSCSIVTTRPNELMAQIHDRMPVILAPKDWDLWLDPAVDDVAELRGLLVPPPANGLEAYPVSTLVNGPRNEGAELLAPVPGEVLRA